MPCEKIDLGKFGTAIVCTRGQRRAKCHVCRKNVGTLQCDFPTQNAKSNGDIITCDKFLCRDCAISRGELDYCPSHGVK